MDRIKFAAIDIGSNAVRLLIMSVSLEDDEDFNKELMIRIPLRLGEQAFVDKKFSDSKRKQLLRTMKAFHHLMNVYEVESYRACATAAMREAKNSKDVVKEIAKEADIKIDIIDGREEALMVYESHFLYNLNDQQDYAFIDVGGGSTEVSIISNGELVFSNSYKIGTVRLLFDKVEAEEYIKLQLDMAEIKQLYQIHDMIASGGNIIKLNTLAKTRKDRKFQLTALREINDKLKELNVDERIKTFDLKPDRADVITNAGDIYLDVAELLGAKAFIVPKIGLIDGLIHLQYTKWKSKKKNKKYFPELSIETDQAADLNKISEELEDKI